MRAKPFKKTIVHRGPGMIELKKEVNELYESLNEPQRYPLDFEKRK